MSIVITTTSKYLIGPFKDKEEVKMYIEVLHPAPYKILYSEKTITILKETVSSTVGFSLPSLKEIEKYTYFEILSPSAYMDKTKLSL